MTKEQTAITAPKMEAVAVRIDGAIERAIASQALAGRMSAVLALADAVQDIREALNTAGVLDRVMSLQGSAIGFKSDKVYDKAVVADAVIEASMHGVRLVGNEFNIIGGRCYITKEGMGRKLNSIAGLKWVITPGIPSGKDGGAIVPMKIEWEYNGNKNSRDMLIPVKMNVGMGADALIGKATRKARAWLYQTVSGTEVPDGDTDDIPVSTGTIQAVTELKPLLPELPAETKDGFCD